MLQNYLEGKPDNGCRDKELKKTEPGINPTHTTDEISLSG